LPISRAIIIHTNSQIAKVHNLIVLIVRNRILTELARWQFWGTYLALISSST
jgi:hypothetical protein